MNFSVFILLTLVQFSALGQLGQWTKETVAKNKVKVASVYIKVPKTNPAYYGKPQGLMLISETRFGRGGLVIENVCKDCAVCFDCDREPADVVEKFHFIRNKLDRIEHQSWDKSTSVFYYDTIGQRKLTIILDKTNTRIELELAYLSKNGKEWATFGIKFGNTWVEGDSVHQIFLSKSSSTYTDSTWTKKEFGYGSGTRIDKLRFDVFEHSLDFDKISTTFESLNYSHLDLWKYLTTYYDSNGNESRIIDDKEGKPVREYKRNKKGLIDSELIHFPKYTFEHLYKYEFWD